MARLRGWLRLDVRGGADAERDVSEEVRLHIELRTAELMASGLDAAEAEAEARRRFARDARTVRALYTTAKDRNRHMRSRERWESLVQDARCAARGLLRDPLLATFVVATLALGIGANVTAFSLVDRLLVRDPAHVRDADRLVRVYAETAMGAAGQRTSSWLPAATWMALREGMRAFEEAGAYRIADGIVGVGLEARRRTVGQTAGGFFQALGTQPLHGRLFAGDEDASATGAVAVLSEAFWRAELGGDLSVLGDVLYVHDEPHTVVGIVPGGFTGTEPRRVDVWVVAASRTMHTQNWTVVGRLRPMASSDEASAEAAAVHRRTAAEGPEWFADSRLFTAPLHYGSTGRRSAEATMAGWLACVSAIILLVTFANVVNLLLVRLVRRRRELAIRLALGSGRGRVVRLLALEGALLALAAGAASLLVTRLTEPIVRDALFAGEAGWSFSLLDARVILTLLLVIAVTAAVVAIVPAVQLGDPRLGTTLRGGERGGSATSKLRSTLTVVQAALSVVLLIGAGLFVRSMANVWAVDLGVEADRVVTATANLAQPAASSEPFATRELAVYRRMLANVSDLPGVEHATISVGRPLDGGWFSTGVWLPGGDSVPSLPGTGPFVTVTMTDYFATVGTPLRSGRTFTDADREGAAPVVIVGETLARTLWPDRAAVGECLHVGEAVAPCRRVVGVVADVKRTGLNEASSLQLYLALGQQTMFGGASLLIRPARTGAVTAEALRAAMLAADPAVRAVEIEPMTEELAGEVRPLRLGVVAFGLSGGLALLVTVLGLYSVMQYMVAWRTREIGVRVALGATGPQITRLVVGGGTALASLGIVLGSVLALIGGRWLQPHLFGTSAVDPLVLGGVAATLLVVALVAGWIPARRALQVRPVDALRAE